MAEMVLVLLIGLAVGVLIAGAVDWYLFDQRAKEQAQQSHAELQRKHAELAELRRTNRKLKQQAADFPTVQTNLERTNAALRDVQKSLEQSTAESARLKGNLERTSRELDGLQSEIQLLREQNTSAESNVRALQTQYDSLLDRVTQADRMRTALVVAADKVKLLQSENEQLRQQVSRPELTTPQEKGDLSAETPPAAPPQPEDDLASIPGLDPIYVKRLHESGIHTLDDLARETPERVAEFAGLKSWERADSTGWIAEAKAQLAAAKRPRA